MTFQILTLFPEFFDSFLNTALLKKAIDKKIIQIQLVDIKAFSKSGRADDYPFGGGESMILSYSSLEKAILSLKQRGTVLYLSPKGRPWKAQKAKAFTEQSPVLTLVCGRYGGIDFRFIQDYVDEEISIGDYILNGGETASMVLIESCSRFVKNFMGNKQSHKKDSFEDSLLSAPEWTQPRNIKSHKIPLVILSGHHEKIKEFRFYSSLLLTYLKRPDLLKAQQLEQIPQAESYLKQLPAEELKSLGLHLEKSKLLLL